MTNAMTNDGVMTNRYWLNRPTFSGINIHRRGRNENGRLQFSNSQPADIDIKLTYNCLAVWRQPNISQQRG